MCVPYAKWMVSNHKWKGFSSWPVISMLRPTAKCRTGVSKLILLTRCCCSMSSSSQHTHLHRVAALTHHSPVIVVLLIGNPEQFGSAGVKSLWLQCWCCMFTTTSQRSQPAQWSLPHHYNTAPVQSGKQVLEMPQSLRLGKPGSNFRLLH